MNSWLNRNLRQPINFAATRKCESSRPQLARDRSRDSPSVSTNRAAVDFHDLKKALRDVLDQLEHTFLNEIFPFTQINPSSENLAKWIYDTMAKKVNDDNIEVASVTVWDSDTASASYFE
jgi:6-pyruvoyl-tetrahydropterin synthase